MQSSLRQHIHTQVASKKLRSFDVTIISAKRICAYAHKLTLHPIARWLQSHLDFHWPGEVADIHVECNVGVAAEIELLVGETVLELLYVAAGDDGDLLTGLSPSCTETKKEGFNTAYCVWGIWTLHLTRRSFIPKKLVAHVMFRLKFLEALINMSRSRFVCKDNQKGIYHIAIQKYMTDVRAVQSMNDNYNYKYEKCFKI